IALSSHLTHYKSFIRRKHMKRFYVTVSLIAFAALLSVFTGYIQGQTSVIHAAGVLSGSSSAYAYIASAQITSPVNVSLGPLAQVGRACSTLPSTTATNSINTLTLGTPATGIFATLATGQDSATTTRSSTSIGSQASATAQHVNILNGLITADVLKAVATSNLTLTNATSSSLGTIFTNLVIAGKHIDIAIAPNTVINLAHLGYVVLNEQSQLQGNPDHTSISINMIDIHITLANAFKLPIGTHIVIVHTSTDVVRTAHSRILNGYAYDYTATLQVGGVNDSSGPLTSAALPCSGGTSQNSAVSITRLPLNFGQIGISTASTSGQIAPSDSSASAQINIVKINLLSGLIRIDALDSKSEVEQGNPPTTSASTTFTHATIAGIVISAKPRPNTRVNLLGIGYVVLN